MVGVSRSYMSCIERAVRIPSVDVAARIISILELPSSCFREQDAGRDDGDANVTLGRVRNEFYWKLRALRMSRGLSVQGLCESADGVKAGVRAWRFREFEIGGRKPSSDEMVSLAAAFGFDDVCRFEAELDHMSDDVAAVDGLAANVRAAYRLQEDGPLSFGDVGPLSETSFICDSEMLRGSLPMEASFIIDRCQIVGDRAAPVTVGDLVIVVAGFAAVGVGRLGANGVVDANGRVLDGDPVKVKMMVWA
ncbi:hypothetical protein GCM10019059_39750 [Camelimonas fluminis]|nr:hypothetical protein GCM10019059_39750 [Camelimonas fluminis]